MTNLSRLLVVGALIGGSFAPAFADTAVVDTTEVLPEAVTSLSSTNPTSSPVEQSPPTEPGPLGTVAINGDALETYRGGAEVSVSNENFLHGAVSENQASNLTTGSNLVTEGSFAGANGLSTVIQNSGNNVLIQNSTIVNLQVQ